MKLSGLAVVVIILFSALIALYEAVSRLIYPHEVVQLGWLAIAGVIGFIGNETVAVFRIRVGRQMNSAALIADGYHARTDGITSLAVVLGAFGVWMGFPLADPIIGLLITIAIFGIVWQSARAVLTRMLDGVDPAIIDEAPCGRACRGSTRGRARQGALDRPRTRVRPRHPGRFAPQRRSGCSALKSCHGANCGPHTRADDQYGELRGRRACA
jgi:Co/Zn/Cd efflux system component